MSNWKKKMNSKKKAPKKNDVPKDKVLKAIEGVRFRWSGDNLRRSQALIVGSRVLISEKVAHGARKRWVELDPTESVYTSRSDVTKELARKAEVLYCWNDDKIEKVFRKTVPGGGIRYVPEGLDESFFGSHRYHSLAKDGKLFKTRAQAVRFAIKELRSEAAKSAKHVFAINDQIKALSKSR